MTFDSNNPFGLSPEELAKLPSRVRASRASWLTKLDGLRPKDAVVIHPLDGLTAKMIHEALRAQGYPPGKFIVMGHGNALWVIRSATDKE